MWFLCIIDMVIWERWGIIKHSSIYKGRLARSLRVSEWDRHLWKVRYSQVQDEMRRKPPPNKFPASFRVTAALGGRLPPWKWATRTHNRGSDFAYSYLTFQYVYGFSLWVPRPDPREETHVRPNTNSALPNMFTYYLVAACCHFLNEIQEHDRNRGGWRRLAQH